MKSTHQSIFFWDQSFLICFASLAGCEALENIPQAPYLKSDKLTGVIMGLVLIMLIISVGAFFSTMGVSKEFKRLLKSKNHEKKAFDETLILNRDDSQSSTENKSKTVNAEEYYSGDDENKEEYYSGDDENKKNMQDGKDITSDYLKKLKKLKKMQRGFILKMFGLCFAFVGAIVFGSSLVSKSLALTYTTSSFFVMAIVLIGIGRILTKYQRYKDRSSSPVVEHDAISSSVVEDGSRSSPVVGDGASSSRVVEDGASSSRVVENDASSSREESDSTKLRMKYSLLLGCEVMFFLMQLLCAFALCDQEGFIKLFSTHTNIKSSVLPYLTIACLSIGIIGAFGTFLKNFCEKKGSHKFFHYKRLLFGGIFGLCVGGGLGLLIDISGIMAHQDISMTVCGALFLGFFCAMKGVRGGTGPEPEQNNDDREEKSYDRSLSTVN